MMLDLPSVTARVSGEGPELRMLRATAHDKLDSLMHELADLEAWLAEEHQRHAGMYTLDLQRAGEFVGSAWRNLTYADQAARGN